MYIMNLGEDVRGECYVTPPDENNEMRLMGKYYDGTEVKLIMFRKPMEKPEKESIEGRVRMLEEWKHYMIPYVEFYAQKVTKLMGGKFRTEEFPDYEMFKADYADKFDKYDRPEPDMTGGPEDDWLVRNVERFSTPRND